MFLCFERKNNGVCKENCNFVYAYNVWYVSVLFVKQIYS